MTSCFESTTLWRLSHPLRPVARAIVIPRWDCTTLTFWLGDELQTAIDFALASEARAAADAIRVRLRAGGWVPAQ
jgi:hypothetical protein